MKTVIGFDTYRNEYGGIELQLFLDGETAPVKYVLTEQRADDLGNELTFAAEGADEK
jgi:hypothetical protein